MKIVRLMTATLVTAATLIGLSAPARALTRHSFTNAAGTLEYLLFRPDQSGPLPLVVFLNGCGADPQAYGLDRFAQAKGFAVAYPSKPGNACWNWPQDRHRDAGETSIIAGITREVQAQNPIDPARTFVAGHSAGSGMAANLAAAYPDLYAAAALISGCGQLTCADVTGTTAYREMGPRARAVPAYIVWGSDDQTDPYPLGRLQLLQWLSTNDLADDGSANLSMPRLPTSLVLRPGYTIERYRDRPKCGSVDFATLQGAGHIPDFTSPAVFPAMTDFLLGNPLRPAC